MMPNFAALFGRRRRRPAMSRQFVGPLPTDPTGEDLSLEDLLGALETEAGDAPTLDATQNLALAQLLQGAQASTPSVRDAVLGQARPRSRPALDLTPDEEALIAGGPASAVPAALRPNVGRAFPRRAAVGPAAGQSRLDFEMANPETRRMARGAAQVVSASPALPVAAALSALGPEISALVGSRLPLAASAAGAGTAAGESRAQGTLATLRSGLANLLRPSRPAAPEGGAKKIEDIVGALQFDHMARLGGKRAADALRQGIVQRELQTEAQGLTDTFMRAQDQYLQIVRNLQDAPDPVTRARYLAQPMVQRALQQYRDLSQRVQPPLQAPLRLPGYARRRRIDLG